MPQQAFEYLDKACLAAASAAHGCSNAPVWQLSLQGRPPADALRTALAHTLQVFPTCAALAVPLDGDPETAKRWAWQWPDQLGLAHATPLLDVVDLTDQPEAALLDLRQQLWDRFLDLTQRPGLQLTLVYTAADRGELFVQHHHALGDGRAFLGFFTRLFGFLDLALRGQQPSADQLQPVPRRSELEVLGLGKWQRVGLALLGIWEFVRGLVRTIRRPVTELLPNASLDYTGSNRILYLRPSAADWQRWRAAARQAGVGLNALLCAAYLQSQVRWHAQPGSRQQRPVSRLVLSTIAESRPRDPTYQSFANHLLWPVVDVDLPAPDVLTLAREVQRQLQDQQARRAPLKRYLVERGVVLSAPLRDVRKMLFEAKQTLVNLNFSNVLALPIPHLVAGEGSGRVQLVAGNVAPPTTPRTALCLTAMACGQEATLNLNYKASIITDTEAAEVGAHLLAVLDEASAGR